MTQAQEAQAEGLEGFVPGPWEVVHDDDGQCAIDASAGGGLTWIVQTVDDSDEGCHIAFLFTEHEPSARLIASAPSLLAEVKRLRQQRDKLVETATRVEVIGERLRQQSGVSVEDAVELNEATIDLAAALAEARQEDGEA